MSEQPCNDLTWHELAALDPSDPRRRAFEDQLECYPADERAHWIEVLANSDRLYTQMMTPQMDKDLEEKLLAIPDAPMSISKGESAARKQPIWVRYAAVFLLIGSIVYGFYAYNQYENSLPAVALNQQLADTIAQMAVSNQAAPVTIDSSDPNVVQKEFGKADLPFTPAVLHPSAPLALQGGGVVYYQSHPIAFTRWNGSGVTYTLYQFAPKALDVPRKFMRMTDSVSSNRVVLWPGANGACTWALVLNTNKARDYFSDSYLY